MKYYSHYIIDNERVLASIEKLILTNLLKFFSVGFGLRAENFVNTFASTKHLIVFSISLFSGEWNFIIAFEYYCPALCIIRV